MEDNKNPNIKRRHHYGYRGRTNFYPLYDSDDDRVEAIQPISGVLFQRVLPHYEISSTETRDSGLGPVFDAEPQILPVERNGIRKTKEKQDKTKAVQNPFLGKLLDKMG